MLWLLWISGAWRHLLTPRVCHRRLLLRHWLLQRHCHWWLLGCWRLSYWRLRYWRLRRRLGSGLVPVFGHMIFE